MTDLKTRYVGNCPVCEGDFKLTPDGQRLVHHGYKRPGDGMIHGDCFAVDYEPYEVSDRGCREYKDAVQATKEGHESYLKRLEAGEVRKLTKEKSRGAYRLPEFVEVNGDSEDAGERADFERLRGYKINEMKSRITQCEQELARMDRRIAAWVKKPIKTWEEAAAEVAARTKAEREARRAILEEKRSAKRAKEAALKAKYAAWEAEKVALIAKYRETFEKLAASDGPLPNRQQNARIAWAEMHKAKNRKGYLHFYENKLDCEAALITLGLAKVVERSGRPWTAYAYPDGHLGC